MVSTVKPSITSQMPVNGLSKSESRFVGQNEPQPFSRQERVREVAPDQLGFLKRTTQALFGRQQAPVVNQPVPAAPATPLAPSSSLPPEMQAQVLQAEAICLERHGLAAGGRMLIYVDNELMMLRRTKTGDGFVLQTPEKTHSEPFSGLYFGRGANGEPALKMNMQDITPQYPYAFEIARHQLTALLRELTS